MFNIILEINFRNENVYYDTSLVTLLMDNNCLGFYNDLYIFRLVKKWNEEPGDWEDDDPVELVKNGDLIRLEHVPTGRNLHSHREPAPVTKRHHQVTGYGEVSVHVVKTALLLIVLYLSVCFCKMRLFGCNCGEIKGLVIR